jgi:hypothetical protein
MGESLVLVFKKILAKPWDKKREDAYLDYGLL